MTLTIYNSQYSELFANCVMWWTGRDTSILGFPIIPSGVTPTTGGTFSSDLNLGNNITLKTFNGSSNYITLTNSWIMGI